MRITVDIDDETERKARANAGAQRKSLSQVVNESLQSTLPKTVRVRIEKPKRIKIK